MTEKRFREIISIQKVIDNQTGKEYDCLIDDELLKLLNELAEENQKLKFQLEECKHNKLFSRRELEEQNKELKERNNRQCRQLDKLYKLIEHQDWYKLNSIIQELKEADERLQKEWKDIE